MSNLKREFVPGSYYHVYNRGVGKQKIFLDESDKSRMTHLLYLCNGAYPFKYKNIPMKDIFEFTFNKGENLVEISSWVLMDNHFHILIFLPEDKSPENITKFITKLSSSYLKYFNEKYNRTGALMEGRYQCIPVADDFHLKYLYSYIHLNPLKMMDKDWKQNKPKTKKCITYLNDYKFSSYSDLVMKKKRDEVKILTNDPKVIQISQIANNLDKLYSLFSIDPRGS